MTTYNATNYSATVIATDLQLFFELHDHSYCNDRDFAERWGDYIKGMIVERLWNYGKAVFDTELGIDTFKIDGVEQTLREALAEFARVCDPEDPKIWWGDRWCDLTKCEGCEAFGVSIDDDGEMDCSPCGTMQFCPDCHRNRYFFCVDCDEFRSREVQSTDDGEYCVDCLKDDEDDEEEEKRQAEERKKVFEARPRFTYKCRVECPADIDRVMAKMAKMLNEGAHFITTEIKADEMDFGSGPITLPDREWTFTAIQDLGTIRTIFRQVEDLHVGLQTLQLEADYTGERDYDLA